MSLDLTVLRLLKYRDRYTKLHRAIPMDTVSERTRIILQDFGAYFREFPEVLIAGGDAWWLWFSGFKHKTISDADKVVYRKLFFDMMSDVELSVEHGLMARLIAADSADKILKLIEQWNAGDEVDLYSALRNTIDQFELDLNRKAKVPWVKPNINDLLQQDIDDTGLHWRLTCINEAMRPLRGGDFGIVAGRPDRGKTSFLTDQLTFMAKQLFDVHGNSHPIAWFNNEGPGERIYQRCYNSALNMDNDQLIELKKSRDLEELYSEAIGHDDMIRIMDVHDAWNHEIEAVIKVTEPGLIVFDMIDNIKFGGNVMNGGQRTDQLLEAMYQWARVLGVKYDCPVIATSQISAEGDGVPYPTLPMLKDSKTGKQGAADWIMPIGASNDPSMENARFISFTKNKLRRPKRRALKQELEFNGAVGRYTEPQ